MRARIDAAGDGGHGLALAAPFRHRRGRAARGRRHPDDYRRIHTQQGRLAGARPIIRNARFSGKLTVPALFLSGRHSVPNFLFTRGSPETALGPILGALVAVASSGV
jgi:hypothetical protein